MWIKNPLISSVFYTFGIAICLLQCLQTIHAQSQKGDIYISNLTPQCLHCLCVATSNCNLTYGCQQSYCGPYKLSRVYWADAGKEVMPEDDPERSGAFEDCALHYECAQRVVKNYLARYGRDCNNDGVTDCTDFSMINANGGYQCSADLQRSENGRNWLKRYARCSPTLTSL